MTELYLYTILHVRRGIPRLITEHAAALDKASRTLFGRGYKPDIRQLTGRIVTLTRAERYPDGVSGFVRLELTADGQERLVPAGISLYDGYALRSLMPNGTIVAYDLPDFPVSTSAGEAAAALAERMARVSGATVGVQSSRTGLLPTADNAPLFALKGREVYTSAPESVYRDFTLRSAQVAGLAFLGQPLRHEELASFDELFYTDHRGITALAHCDGHPYMSLAAERLARAMESFFQQKGVR